MSDPMYGGGISYGHLYFSFSVGLAPKKVSDGGVGGSGLSDDRNGTKGLEYEDNGGLISGFGFSKLLIDTHFDARGRLGRIIPGLIQTKKSMGIGIDENTCLFYNNGIGTVFGDHGVFVVDISNGIQNKAWKYFNLKQVVVSHLTSGDRFDFQNKIVKSSKPIIKEPKFSGYTDSSDIFKSYECSFLMERLVDQTGKYNVGMSKVPSGYPGSAPKFELKFYSSINTKGYYSEEKKQYTVEKVMMDLLFE